MELIDWPALFLSETTDFLALVFGMKFYLLVINQIHSKYDTGAKHVPNTFVTCFTVAKIKNK